MSREDSISEEKHRADDEISLTDLAEAVWNTRVPVALLLAVFTAGFWLFVSFGTVKDAATRTYSTHITFTFSGVNEGRYPNGTAFASADLIAPVILKRVYESNGLEGTEIPFDRFADSFSIASLAPAQEYITERFRRKLGKTGLTVAEIRRIEQEFTEALDRAHRGRAVLTFTLRESVLPAHRIIDEPMAAKLLLDIPRLWARYMIEEAGVFSADVNLYSSEVLNVSMLGAMDFLVAYDVLKEKISLLRHNIETLQNLPNSSHARDPETGYRLSDLFARASDIEDYVLDGTLSPALAMGISRNPDHTIRFFENRIQHLERRRSLMEARAKMVEAALHDYVSTPPSVAGRRPAVPEMPKDAELTGLSIPQFGGDFLDRLMQLGVDTGDIQFRQDLSRERLDYLLSAADLESEVSRLERLVALVGGQPELPKAPPRNRFDDMVPS